MEFMIQDVLVTLQEIIKSKDLKVDTIYKFGIPVWRESWTLYPFFLMSTKYNSSLDEKIATALTVNGIIKFYILPHYVFYLFE